MMKFLRTVLSAVAIVAVVAGAGMAASPAYAASTTVFAAPGGSGSTCTADAPCDLGGAQAAVRAAMSGSSSDVVVELAGGRYRIAEPLTFEARDGGGDSASVTWRSAAGQTAVITGADVVTGWSVADASKNIWSAPIPVGVDSRDLYVDGVASPRATMPVARGDIDFTPAGITLKTPELQALAALPQQDRIQLRAKNWFTDRYSGVSRIVDGTAEMTQPAWQNNTWGYDTISSPIFGYQTLSLENSLSFISDPGEWYVDPDAGRLYYKPADGTDPATLDIELPRLESLVSIGGTYDEPVRNLSFERIQFSGTSWLAPSVDGGLASQQAGSYLSGARDYYPADALTSCAYGCPAFERARNSWGQQPAAVQVSAARDISFVGNRFIGLGQIALGIGNDANATATGVGLGAQDITVRGNLFTQLGGGGIVAGGILADAHHPSRPEMVNSGITIDANTIMKTSFTYGDNSGILSTYVDTAVITRNEVARLPYDAIDIGYGWGINDPGGSDDYVQRGYYQTNPKYDTPTTFRNNLVANNYVHDIKEVFGDGGALYALSASPGTVIRDNYASGLRNTVGLYLDEGSRYITTKNNVIRDASHWVFNNTGPGRNTRDNTIENTWHIGGNAQGEYSDATNIRIVNDYSVTGNTWPAAAKAIICSTGVPEEYRTSLNTDACATLVPTPCAVGAVCESEDGLYLGEVATNHPGYTGRGFIGELVREGTSSAVAVTAPTAGEYTATIRYAAGPGLPSLPSDRTMTLTVGDTKKTITLPSTGWDTWSTIATRVSLPQGTSMITISAEAGDTAWVNLDSVTVTAAATVSPQVTSASQPNAAGWYRTAPTVSLTASDPTATVTYRLDDAAPVAYTAPIPVSKDGVHAIAYQAGDRAGVIAGSAGVLNLLVDATAPVTSVTTTPAGGTATEGSAVSATFAAVDATSGVARTEYSVNGSPWASVPAGGLSYSAKGAYDIRYRSVDAADNVESDKTVRLTVAAASTTAAVKVTSAGAVQPGGWYQQAVVISLTAPASSGTKVQYNLDGAGWRSYSSGISVSSDGRHTLAHRLTRNSVVVDGSTAEVTFKIDKTAPVVTAVRSPAGTGTPRNPVDVVFTASDAVSGLAVVEYRINSGAWAAATDSRVTLGEVGDYVVSYRAVDTAGNTSAAKSTTVVIKADPVTAISATSKVRAGDALTVSLAGFIRYDNVTVTLGGRILQTVLTDVNGAARVTVRIPADTPAGAAKLEASGSGGLSVSRTLTVSR